MPGKRVFVTTGATAPFQALLDACLSDAILQQLSALGFTHMVVQCGPGADTPASTTRHGVAVSTFDLKPSLASDIASSDLVISHAGTGSILDALRQRKPLIAVVNTALMGNHQLQIASLLSKDGHLLMTTPEVEYV